MRDLQQLDHTLRQLEGRPYGAYKSISGEWSWPLGRLFFDYVQADPFATPSRVRLQIPADWAGLPPEVLGSGSRRRGVASLLARTFSRAAAVSRSRDRVAGNGKSGEIGMSDPGQVVGQQTAVQVSPAGEIEVRIRLGLPAQGRRIRGLAARTLIVEELTTLVSDTLSAEAHDPADLLRGATTNEDQDALRAALIEHSLVAFVADGALLPRLSGREELPLSVDEAVRFQSPESLRVTLPTPNSGPVTGLGVPEGITLVVGGGFHGKSTLLRAIDHGVRNHCPDDGRERVVARVDAVKVRAEDGRAVAGVDITPFINGLPGGRTTAAFTTPNASGSTSQAAAIAEALEVGAGTLLIDEDTAATNFMIRDRRMQELVPAEREPITPFVDRVRAMHTETGVNAVLVLGGSGDYLDVADTVIGMADFLPEDLTTRAREVAAAFPTGRHVAEGDFPWARSERIPRGGCVSARKGRRDRRIRIYRGGVIEFGAERIDLSAMEQVEGESELRAIASALALAGERYIDGVRSIPEALTAVMNEVEARGLDALDPRRLGDLAEFRIFEVAAALNRLRTLQIL